MTEADRQAIADELHQLNLALNEMGETGDVDGMVAYWVEDPSAYFVGDPALFLQSIRLLPTKDAMREFFAPMQASRSGTKFTVLKDHVAVLSPDLAVQVVEHTFSVIDTLGNAGPEYPQTSTAVWVRENGEWKMLHFHQSWSTTPIE
jgi:uncharacterized protein (TIGR02246 family)